MMDKYLEHHKAALTDPTRHGLKPAPVLPCVR
jgi:hypothetical protein